jgi:hypothetical protein
MSEVALPKIKVTDEHHLDGGTNGASILDTPSTTTDGGHSIRPRSATSSEGIFPKVSMQVPVLHTSRVAIEHVPMLYRAHWAGAN